MTEIFIDGSAGTTGLRLYERLIGRDDLSIVTLTGDDRKDPAARRAALNSCDVAFLCLPDDASREAVAMTDDPDTVIIDTSTAHRTLPDWAYGFPELSSVHRKKIATSHRIAVPGCHASGFVALIYPLVANGFIPASCALSCFSLTGYSGGGKKMIAEYEADSLPPLYGAPRQYALTQQHKHLREMKAIPSLDAEPIFCPVVADFYSGMEVTVPLFKKDLLNGYTSEDVKNLYKNLYNGPLVKYNDVLDEAGFASAAALSGKDTMEITVAGCDERILLISRFDNLGKGASGAAIECLNVLLGLPDEYGLEI